MSKYLKYAIGEIILVVLGILIALQINNWNEDKKTKTKEKEALTEIVSDLKLNVKSLDSVLNFRNTNIDQNIKSLIIVINALEKKQNYNDSLNFHFFNSFTYADVFLKSSGYESLTSIGMDLVSSHEIRSEIGKYYTEAIPKFFAALNEARDDFYHYMLDYRRTKFIDSIGSNTHEKLMPIDYDALKQNRTLIESLKAYLSVYEYYKTVAISTKKKAQQLTILIEGYIN